MDEVEKEVERRVAAMTHQQRDHLRTIIYALVKCYDEYSADCAVVMLGTSDGLNDVLTLNCDPMHAANMLLATNDLFEFINTRGAPPKEKFN